jgi:hypothetical protein
VAIDQLSLVHRVQMNTEEHQEVAVESLKGDGGELSNTRRDGQRLLTDDGTVLLRDVRQLAGLFATRILAQGRAGRARIATLKRSSRRPARECARQLAPVTAFTRWRPAL